MYAPAIKLGIGLRLLAEGPDVGAAQIFKDVMVGDYTDYETVREFAAGCDVITFDHEHVPTRILRDLVGRQTDQDSKSDVVGQLAGPLDDVVGHLG